MAGAVAWTVGAVYLVLARALGVVHRTDRLGQGALTAFRLWWAATGLNILLGGTVYAAASFGLAQLEFQVAYAVFQRFLLAVSLAGLLHYFGFLLTGKSLLAAIIPYYTFHFLFLVYGVVHSQPSGVYIGLWRTDIERAVPATPLYDVVGAALLLLPPIVGCVGSLVASRRLSGPHERSRRLRLRIVASSILVWWIVAVIAGQREARGLEEFQFVNRFFGLLVAIVVLLAFRPPAWLQDRWGLRPYPV